MVDLIKLSLKDSLDIFYIKINGLDGFFNNLENSFNNVVLKKISAFKDFGFKDIPDFTDKENDSLFKTTLIKNNLVIKKLVFGDDIVMTINGYDQFSQRNLNVKFFFNEVSKFKIRQKDYNFEIFEDTLNKEHLSDLLDNVYENRLKEIYFSKTSSGKAKIHLLFAAYPNPDDLNYIQILDVSWLFEDIVVTVG